MKLVKGEGSKETGACWMSAIAWYEGNLNWTDVPDCVCPIIRHLGIWVNDQIDSDEERERLISPIMFSVVGTVNPDLVLPRKQKVVAFAVAKARSVLHLVSTEHTNVARKAIAAAEAWAANPSEANRKAAADAADAADAATHAAANAAAHAAYDAAYAAADAADAADAANAADAADTTLGNPKSTTINEVINLILELAAMGEKRQVAQVRDLKVLV